MKITLAVCGGYESWNGITVSGALPSPLLQDITHNSFGLPF
jgi:hypothetical protein